VLKHLTHCRLPACAAGSQPVHSAHAAIMASDQLVWQILKGHNSFVRKGLNGLVLSAEPGNLYNKHSYKYSGTTSAESSRSV
jgi:Ribosomal L28e protein family